MIDWNKRNGGFLSPESVYENQLGNLSMQINQKDKEIERLNNNWDKLEKYINKMIEEDSKYNDIASRYGLLNCKNILNRLKKLKGGE